MSARDNSGSAFPETRWDDVTRQSVQWMGLTKREYFAIRFATALIETGAERRGSVINGDKIISDAILAADALIKELAK